MAQHYRHVMRQLVNSQPVVLQLLFKLFHAAKLLLLLSYCHLQLHHLGLLLGQLHLSITGTLQSDQA